MLYLGSVSFYSPSRLSKLTSFGPPVSFETLSGGAFSSLVSLAGNKRNYHSHGASGTHSSSSYPVKVSEPLANLRIHRHCSPHPFARLAWCQARYMPSHPSSPLPRQVQSSFSSSWCPCPHGPASAPLRALTSTTLSLAGFVSFFFFFFSFFCLVLSSIPAEAHLLHSSLL